MKLQAGAKKQTKLLVLWTSSRSPGHEQDSHINRIKWNKNAAAAAPWLNKTEIYNQS
jgi:hypothetical protein